MSCSCADKEIFFFLLVSLILWNAAKYCNRYDEKLSFKEKVLMILRAPLIVFLHREQSKQFQKLKLQEGLDAMADRQFLYVISAAKTRDRLCIVRKVVKRYFRCI